MILSLVSMKLVHWNVRGISSRKKQYVLWQTLLSSQWDVLCAVEHKQHAQAGSGFEHRDFHVFFNGLHSTNSGVMMIVHDRFRPSVVHRDVHGRFLIVEITYEEQLLWLVGVYAPHSVGARCSLWRDLQQCLRFGKPGFLMGDFNICSSADQSNSPHSIMDNPERRVWDSFVSLVLKQDIWHWLHPHDSGFTFQSCQHHGTWSRLDRMYIMHDDLFLPEILQVDVERQHVLSDHFPLVLHMMHQPVGVYKSLLGRLPLRFNHSFLDHEVFHGYMLQLIDNFQSCFMQRGISA